MVKAIIFDCFGVLATEAWLPFKAKYFGHDKKLHAQVSDISHQANRGLVSYEEAMTATAKLAGITPAEAMNKIRQNVPNQELFDYISRELKPHYKIGFLSNVADGYMRQLFSKDQQDLFDSITLSYKTGYIKPEPEAYADAAQSLGVNLQDCVLIDDSETNVAGARQAGMQAVLYQSFDRMKADLEKILADSKG